MTGQDPLTTALWEANRHCSTLQHALQDWHAAPAANLVDHPETRFAAIEASVAAATELVEVYHAWRAKLGLSR